LTGSIPSTVVSKSERLAESMVERCARSFWLGYADATILKEGELVSPLVKPGLRIAVSDLLP